MSTPATDRKNTMKVIVQDRYGLSDYALVIGRNIYESDCMDKIRTNA